MHPGSICPHLGKSEKKGHHEFVKRIQAESRWNNKGSTRVKNKKTF